MNAVILAIIFFTNTVFVGGDLFADEKNEEIVFPKETISVGQQKLLVEVATTLPQQQRGLMFRKNLAPGTGMLFVYEAEAPLVFWMKNTLIPLSIGFFDQKGKLVDIQDMKPASLVEKNLPTYAAKKPSRFALEVPVGWFKQKGIKTGEYLQRNETK